MRILTGRSKQAGARHTSPMTPGRVEAKAPKTMSVREAAAELGLGVAAIYSAVRDGTIPAIRVGRRIRVPRQVVERLLAEGTPDGRARDPGQTVRTFHRGCSG